jgi:predicted DNA-binding protein
MRVLIDLPDDDIDWLDRQAAGAGKSRAALVREIITAYRTQTGKNGIERFFGAWKTREDIGDGVESQRRARDEWDRA